MRTLLISAVILYCIGNVFAVVIKNWIVRDLLFVALACVLVLMFWLNDKRFLQDMKRLLSKKS